MPGAAVNFARCDAEGRDALRGPLLRASLCFCSANRAAAAPIRAPRAPPRQAAFPSSAAGTQVACLLRSSYKTLPLLQAIMPHLLLVDDDPEAIDWLTELAKGEGFTVST